jgi:hypothetical protein
MDLIEASLDCNLAPFTEAMLYHLVGSFLTSMEKVIDGLVAKEVDCIKTRNNKQTDFKVNSDRSKLHGLSERTDEALVTFSLTSNQRDWNWRQLGQSSRAKFPYSAEWLNNLQQ